MTLNINLDSSYLSESKVDPEQEISSTSPIIASNTLPMNGAIHVCSSIMQSLIASVIVAEVGAISTMHKGGNALHTTKQYWTSLTGKTPQNK